MLLPSLHPARVRYVAGLLIAGFVVFLLGVFSILLFPSAQTSTPIWDFRAGPSATRMLQAVAPPYRAPWITANILTLISPILTAIGLIMLTDILSSTNVRRLAIIGLISIVVATAVWVFHQYLAFGLALGDPQRPSDLLPFVGISSLFNQMQAVFEILTVTAGVLYGVCLWRSGLLKRMGMVASILNGVLLGLALFAGGMPPIVPYFITALIGIGLLARRRPISAPA